MGFFDDLLGKSGAKAASDLGARNAARLNSSYADANENAKVGYDTSLGYLKPYAETGGNAYNLLSSSYGANGNDARNSAFQTFQGDPFAANSNQLTQNALYNLMKRYNARGQGNSGVSNLALSRAGLEANDRRVADWRSGLQGLGNTGFQAAGAQSGLTSDYYNGVSNRAIGLGNALASNDTNATIAASNARAAGVNNILGIAGTVAGAAFGGFAPGKGGVSTFGNIRNALNGKGFV